jgi:F-type H+-transporting ATPase subunit b
MGEILSQLGHLFVQSIPTVVFVFLLLVILERLFFRPLTTLLQQREEATLGAVARARAQVAAAEARTREYEAAFQTARQDVYRLREAERKRALGERENTLRKAREQSEALLKDAQAGLSRQVEAAKRELESSSRALGLEITEAILGEGKGGAAA